MKDSVVNIRLHGHLGEAVGRDWKLAVSSVKEAVHAINTITKNALYKYLFNKDKEGAKYKILINENAITHKVNFIDDKNAEEIKNTELVMDFENLRSIDIVPIIEGADSKTLSILLVVVGVILIVLGAFTFGALVPIGVALVIGGITMLLAKPPKFATFQDIPAQGGKSYFFGGAVNIINEGGPVPVGYGEAIIGSQVISAGFSVGVRTDSLPRRYTPVTRFYPI